MIQPKLHFNAILGRLEGRNGHHASTVDQVVDFSTRSLTSEAALRIEAWSARSIWRNLTVILGFGDLIFSMTGAILDFVRPARMI